MIITPCVVVCVVGCSNFPLSDAKMKPRVVSDDAVIKLHSKNSSGEMMIEEYMMRVGVGQSGQVLFPSSPGDYFPNAFFWWALFAPPKNDIEPSQTRLPRSPAGLNRY